MIKFPPKKILAAYDFSDPARLAWKHAAALAASCGASVEVVYVEPWQSGVDLMPPAGLNASRIRTLRGEIRKTAGEGPKITILEGDPAQTILDRAARTRPDLIVVGTHGRKGFQRFLLGSTAESVVRGAHVPVLVARGPVRRVRSILAPINFTPYSDYGFTYAAGAGAVLSAKVTALHVAADPIWGGNVKYRLSGLVSRLPPDVVERCRLDARESAGDAVTGILKAAKGHDWLILVAHERSVLKDALLGTTVERVLRRSPVPVLSVPAPRRGQFILQAAGGSARQ